MEGAWGGVWLLIRSADWRPWAGSGGALGVAGASQNAMPPSGTGADESSLLLLHLGARLVIACQQETACAATATLRSATPHKVQFA